MSIVEEVRGLGLPRRQFVVIGSCSMVMAGIIDTYDDIDLAVVPEAFERLCIDGWERHESESGKPLLSRGIFDVGIGLDPWTTEELLEDAFDVDGVLFMSLKKLLEWKKTAGRPKDVEHVRLIEKYLSTHLQ